MSELSLGQRDTIRLAYSAAEKSGNDTILQNRIQQLSRDFGISEEEVRSIAKDSASVKPTPEHSKSRRGSSPDDWAPDQIRQLMQMHNEGKGPSAIAKALGCEVKRVSAKLYNLKKKGILREPDGAEPAPTSSEAPAPEENAETTEPESKESTPVAIPAIPSVDVHDDADEDPKTFIDMPDALLLLMGLVNEHYGDNVIRVHASNNEHCAACTFEADGIKYDLELEVSEYEAS